jgi:hypothetical protein
LNIVTTAEWLLAEGGSSINEKNKFGETVWSMLLPGLYRAGAAELSSLLQVMSLLGNAPLYFTSRLSSQHADIIKEGYQLRARLPGYLERQHAALITHCPLPAVLQPFVATYAKPSCADIWESADIWRRHRRG